MANAARATAASIAAFAVVVAATGWLYVVQPHARIPGAPVPDALPLDELSRRSAVPLVIFLAVWGAAALLLALVVHAARIDRLTAGVLLALGVGSWAYVETGVALLVVRQVPAHEAFHAAAGLRSVYLPAALAGLAGALGGRERRSVAPRSPRVLSWFVAAVGLLGVVDAALPARPHSVVESLAPERVHGIAHALVAPLGLALLLAAAGLRRSQRRAWHVAVVLLSGLVLLHLLRSFGYGAVATGLVAIALLARRGDFDAPGDPEHTPRVLVRAAVLAAAIGAYACATLWVNRIAADQPFSFRFAARETGRSLAGLEMGGSEHLGGLFGEWFPVSVLLLGAGAAVLLLADWLAPWRYRLRQEAGERQLAHDLVAAWGVDTLAPFTLRADKSYFLGEDERAFLAYRVVGGVAIVSGDPIGPPESLPELVAAFIRFARRRGWRIAVLGASEHRLGLYRAQGLHALYHGDEAIVDVDRFSLEGRPIRKVRQSVHRLRQAGYSASVLRPRELDAALREELTAVASAWRGAEPERGFVMALDTLFRLEDEDAVFVVGRGPDGRPAGFLHFAVCRKAAALSLSSMPRLRTTPNGFNEWLVCETVAWARAEGFRNVSLNFAPFAALLAPGADLSAVQRLERQALLRLKGRFQLDNLLLFNRKFLPAWQRRFVVYERRADLPRVGIAALAAEAYLPFVRRRGE